MSVRRVQSRYLSVSLRLPPPRDFSDLNALSLKHVRLPDLIKPSARTLGGGWTYWKTISTSKDSSIDYMLSRIVKSATNLVIESCSSDWAGIPTFTSMSVLRQL